VAAIWGIFLNLQTYCVQKDDEDAILSFELVVEDPSCRTVRHLAIWSSGQLVLRDLLTTDPGKCEDSFSFSSSGAVFLSLSLKL